MQTCDVAADGTMVQLYYYHPVTPSGFDSDFIKAFNMIGLCHPFEVWNWGCV